MPSARAGSPRTRWAGRGVSEIAGWSFADPALLDRLRLPAGDPMRQVVALENPLSESWSIMRPTLLGSLLDAAQQQRGARRRRSGAVESGTVYARRRGRTAPRRAPRPGAAARRRADAAKLARRAGGQCRLLRCKGLLGAVLDALAVEWSVVAAPMPFLHPGALSIGALR